LGKSSAGRGGFIQDGRGNKSGTVGDGKRVEEKGKDIEPAPSGKSKMSGDSEVEVHRKKPTRTLVIPGAQK